MAQHDEAVGHQRFAPVAAPAPDRQQGVPHDVLTEFALQFVDPFDGA